MGNVRRAHPPVRMQTHDIGPGREAGSGVVPARSCLLPAPRPGVFTPLGHAERDGLCSAWARMSAAMSPRAARWASDRAELPPCGEGRGEDVTARIPASCPGHPCNEPSPVLSLLRLSAAARLRVAAGTLPAGHQPASASRRVAGQGSFTPSDSPPKPPSLRFLPRLKRVTGP